MIKNNKKKYFTLLELIIVIVVIGILAGMALPKFTGVVRNSKVAAMITDIDTLEKAIMMYQQDNDTLPLLEETTTFGLQRLSESDMSKIYTSLQETLKLSEDSEEYLYKINLDESGKYHSKTKYGHGKTDKDFYVYSTKSDKVYYYDYLKDGDNNYNHNEYPIMLTSNELVEKIPSKPIDEKPSIELPPEIKDKWTQVLGGNSSDSFSSIQQTSDGGYIVVGGSESSNGDFNSTKGSSDGLIAKFDVDGNMEWNKRYGGTQSDYFKSVQQTTDNGYIVCGYTNGGGDFNISKGGTDTLILKLDANGDMEWNKVYGGLKTDFLNSIEQTNDGGYITCGYTDGGGDFNISKGSRDTLILKLDANGNMEWNKVYGGVGIDFLNSIKETSDGEYVVVGGTEGGGDFSTSKGKFDALVLKLDINGNIKWKKLFGGSDYNDLESIEETSDKGYIVVGKTKGKGDFPTSSDYYYSTLIVKIDTNGNKEWYKVYDGPEDDYFYSVQQTSDGGYIACGYSYGRGNFDVSKGNLDGLIVKLDINGNMEWNKVIGGSGQDFFYSVQQTSDKGYIICGSTEGGGDFSSTKGQSDALIIKLDSNGNVVK